MRSVIFFLITFVAVIALPAVEAISQNGGTERALYSFNGVSLSGPLSPLTVDAEGNLYGASPDQAGNANGAIFRLSKGPNSWVMSILYEFINPAQGRNPQGNVILDSAGNLYGTLLYNGKSPHFCCGEVYELSPTSSGQWTKTTLYTFKGEDDGGVPGGGLVFDASGNLYGTTSEYGSGGCGTVFELSPASSGAWTETVLYSFKSEGDACNSYGGLIFDKNGNLYGETTVGGSCTSEGGCGTVFELTPASGTWTEKLLYAFTNGTDGGYPSGNLVIDQSGNLYGAASSGGNLSACGGTGCGAVFELSSASGSWTESVLYDFQGANDGAYPYGTLNLNRAGHLFGATAEGGSSCDCGTVFELSPNSGGTWTESVLYAFAGGTDGAYPQTGVSVNQKGSFFGVTYEGGASNEGVIFQFVP